MRPPVKKKDRLRPPAGVEAFVRVNPFSTGSRPNNTRSQLFHRSYSNKQPRSQVLFLLHEICPLHPAHAHHVRQD